jgi:hypothetical protein
VASAAAINQAIINITADPGLYSTNYKYKFANGATCANVAATPVAGTLEVDIEYYVEDAGGQAPLPADPIGAASSVAAPHLSPHEMDELDRRAAERGNFFVGGARGRRRPAREQTRGAPRNRRRH